MLCAFLRGSRHDTSIRREATDARFSFHLAVSGGSFLQIPEFPAKFLKPAMRAPYRRSGRALFKWIEAKTQPPNCQCRRSFQGLSHLSLSLCHSSSLFTLSLRPTGATATQHEKAQFLQKQQRFVEFTVVSWLPTAHAVNVSGSGAAATSKGSASYEGAKPPINGAIGKLGRVFSAA